MTATDRVPTRAAPAETWTPEGYTSFALRSQLPSLWLLSRWIVARAADAGARVRPGDRVLDAGAGPGLLSRLLSATAGVPVEAVPQNAAFARLAARPLLPPSVPGQVTLLPCDALASGRGEYRLVAAYGLLHEADEPAEFVARLARHVAPGGALVLVDTDRAARDAVHGALGETALTPAERAAIAATFASSLSRGEAARLAAALPGDAAVEPVAPDEEILLEAELSRPDELDGDSELDLELDEPSVFALVWRRTPPSEQDPRQKEDP